MADGFAQMIDRATAFFADLAAHNTKDWFEPHKAAYIADIRKPAEFMAELVAEDLSRITGASHKPHVMRIYRDVRFSRDKSPYNPHLHIAWSPAPPGPAFLFGAAPGYTVFGLGSLEMNLARLTAWRAHIDRHGDRVQNALDTAQTLGATFSDWGPEPLKRVPKPFGADHPHADLLRRKSLTLTAPLSEGWREAGLLPTLTRMIPALLPMRRELCAF